MQLEIQMRTFRFLVLILALAQGPAFGDDGRLRAAHTDHDNWLTYGHGYSNQRYSALDDISVANVQRLTPAWIYQTGVLGSFPANPLVVDGVMYLSTPHNHVVALNAATGQERWRYTHEKTQEQLCCGSHNRGVAWGYGRVYMITADGRLVALDAESGEVVWDIPVVDPTTADAGDLASIRRYNKENTAAFESMTRFAGNMAPLVYDGKVIVGVSGTGYSAVLGEAESDSVSLLGRPGVRPGLRAFLTAYDANSGDLLWRWYVASSESWEGEFATTTSFGDVMERDVAAEKANADTYRDAWKGGGGSLYSSPSVDPDLGLIYIGTGNPSPGYADYKRPGDNLHTSSVVALDAETGELGWYHQVVPHDIWGYDVAAPPLLLDVVNDQGKTVPAVAAAAKTGWVYLLNRATGEPVRRSQAFVPQSENMFTRPTTEGKLIAPGAGGGANWPPMAYSPLTDWIYVVASHNPTRYKKEIDDAGKAVNVISYLINPDRWGTVSAVDPDDGVIKWQEKTELPVISGALATAGGLLFHGQSNREFVARDLTDGRRLWSFQTGAGVNAPPVTYRVHGRQYVTVASGGHALFKYPLGDAVIAFALPQK